MRESKDDRITRLQTALAQANDEIATLKAIAAADGTRADTAATLAGNNAGAVAKGDDR